MSKDQTHQGLPVSGYQPQSDVAVALVNANKATEERLLREIEKIKRILTDADPRWLAVAQSHFEQGFMALNRAIFQPRRIALPEDEQ